ncbi:MAG: trans-sulfuration enzyme family protein [Fimbriimonadaceae bacterium]
MSEYKFETLAVQGGYQPTAPDFAITPPIHPSSTYGWSSLEEPPLHRYSRISNPTRSVFESLVGELEGAEHCIAFSSGIAAMTAALGILKPGDTALFTEDIYGGTRWLFDEYLNELGIKKVEFDSRHLSSLQEAFERHSDIRVVVFESPSNPNLRIADIEAICQEAKKHEALTVFDNTFASPALQNPLMLGADTVIHSGTKYLGGHSDLVIGAACTNNDGLAQKLKHTVETTGAAPSPFDCWLAARGIRTLAIRMRQHCENAGQIAAFLSTNPAVSRVHYPGLPRHEGHEIAKRQMKGFGGMVTADLRDGRPAVHRFLEKAKLFHLADSLGGIESLVSYPTMLSHASLPDETKRRLGITDGLLRFSVGIENCDDLIEDLDQALKA